MQTVFARLICTTHQQLSLPPKERACHSGKKEEAYLAACKATQEAALEIGHGGMEARSASAGFGECIARLLDNMSK